MADDIFQGLGIEIKFSDPNDFLKIKETLTRIGIASKRTNTLYQSCHILHKKGRYVVLHFKELFALDGKETNFSAEDKDRRNAIVWLLQEWKLLEIVHPELLEKKDDILNIKIIPFKEKKNWTLEAKYQIGLKK